MADSPSDIAADETTTDLESVMSNPYQGPDDVELKRHIEDSLYNTIEQENVAKEEAIKNKIDEDELLKHSDDFLKSLFPQPGGKIGQSGSLRASPMIASGRGMRPIMRNPYDAAPNYLVNTADLTSTVRDLTRGLLANTIRKHGISNLV